VRLTPTDRPDVDAVDEAELRHTLRAGNSDQKKLACDALAESGSVASLPDLAPLLHDPDLDVAIRAANACLRIERRQFRGLQWLDWVLIGAYACFDADLPGDVASREMICLHPDIHRLRPAAKDWNVVLTPPS